MAVNISELPLVLTSALTAVLFSSDARKRDDEAALGRSSQIALVIAVTLAVAAFCPMQLGSLQYRQEFEPAVVPWIVLFAAVALGTPDRSLVSH